MLEEKRAPDFIDAKRLGVTFDESNIMELYRHLDEAKLPIIPYNASIDELNRLVEHIAGQYAYLQDSYGVLKVQERKCERASMRAFIKEYLNAEQKVAGATQAMLKMVAEATKDVEKADDDLDEIRNRLDVLDARLKALAILDQDARKLLSSGIEAMRQRMD